MRTLNEVRKITQRKDGSIFKTERVCMIWKHLSDNRSDNEIAKEFGGDTLCPASWDEYTIEQRMDNGKQTERAE